MSSSAVPETNQMNFNPSWMRSASATTNAPAPTGKPSTNRVDAPALNVVQDYPLSEPIFVANRYGREDLLALLPKDSTVPDGLERCQFFVEPQQPIVLTPLTDAETRLQHNINSSKAMSALSYADRMLIASGNVVGQGNVTGPPGPTGPASQTSWSGTAGVGRGGGQSARGSFSGFRGRGGQAVASATHPAGASDTANTGRYVAARGRGGAALGRGGSTGTFNSRAQGLYDPRDPRDRPRQRVRSISDDAAAPPTSAAGNGTPAQNAEDASSGSSGWTQQTGRGGWRRYAANGTNAHQHVSVDSSTIARGSMPEWMEEEQDRGPGLVSTRSGSFDENGQFRASDSSSPKETNVAKSGPVLAKIASAKDSKQPETQVRPQISPRAPDPIPISNPWSVIAETSDNRMDIGEQLSKQTQMNLLLSSATVQPLAPSNIFEAKLPEEVVQIPQRQVVQQVNNIVVEDEWYYVDPRNSIQGPFPTAHMEAWFKSGYFTMELNVRRGSNPNSHFQTLGELIRINGATTPFRSKTVETPVVSVPVPVPVHMQVQPQNRELSVGAWTDEYKDSLIKAKVEEERLKLEEEQRRVAEKEKELREMQEKLKRQEEERLMKVREMELQLQKQQEELARRAAEESRRAALREREIEVERKRIAEEIERAKREEIERALAEERRREEEERIAREKEIERMKAEAERLRLENEEAMRKQMEKAKEEARRKAQEEKLRREREQAEKEREKERERERAKAAAVAAAAAAAEAKRQAAIAASKIEVTEEFAPASKPKNGALSAQSGGSSKPWQASYRAGEDKLIAAKVWQPAVEGGEKSLLEIQQEEERQMMAERQQKQEAGIVARSAAPTNPPSAGIWSASQQRLSWNQPTQVTRQVSSPSAQAVAWGGAGLQQDIRPTLNVLFDGPSLESSNKQVKKGASSPTKASKPNQKASWQAGGKQDNIKAEQEAMKKLFKQPPTDSSDGFTNWVVQRVKQLNSQVDADVLAEFIENVDSPDEVEDYIIGYLGDSSQVKDFVREFLAKRGDARLKKRLPIKDDLSGPARAADPSLSASGGSLGVNSAAQQHSVSSKKKKKGKGSRLIVDGACLGFKGTADSNRVNIGEIDTVGATEAGRR